MAAVTLDLWHTLLYLPPENEEEYMDHQLEMGTETLRGSARRPGAPDRPDSELAAAFERAYSAAVAASAEGRTVTPADQLVNAANEVGRVPDPRRYLSMLEAEVDRTPFRRAPGALDLLRRLREKGYRLVVISNTVGEPGRFLRPVLTGMGFDAFVEGYVFSDELPWTKPSPEIFRHALGQVGEGPENAVHVGDGWSDMEGARRAGYRGEILFTGLAAYGDRYRKLFLPGVPEVPDHAFRTDRLSEVGEIVERLLPMR